MAAEKTSLHQDVPVVCTVPSCPEKRASTTDSRVRVLGMVLVTVFIVAGFLGVVYLMSSPRTDKSYVPSSESSDNIYLNGIKEVTVEFNYQETSITEVVKVEDNRQFVTITDIKDGFIVTLDYKRGIAVVKNTSSSDCFFTRLENFPEYQTEDMDNLRPILVEEVDEMPETNHTEETVNLRRSEVIPWEYVQVTSDPYIAGQCTDATSYWLQVNPTHTVQRRDGNCGCVIIIIVCRCRAQR